MGKVARVEVILSSLLNSLSASPPEDLPSSAPWPPDSVAENAICSAPLSLLLPPVSSFATTSSVALSPSSSSRPSAFSGGEENPTSPSPSSSPPDSLLDSGGGGTRGESSLGVFSSEDGRRLSDLLARIHLSSLNNTEQFQLLAVIGALSQMQEHARDLDSPAARFFVGHPPLLPALVFLLPPLPGSSGCSFFVSRLSRLRLAGVHPLPGSFLFFVSHLSFLPFAPFCAFSFHLFRPSSRALSLFHMLSSCFHSLPLLLSAVFTGSLAAFLLFLRFDLFHFELAVKVKSFLSRVNRADPSFSLSSQDFVWALHALNQTALLGLCLQGLAGVPAMGSAGGGMLISADLGLFFSALRFVALLNSRDHFHFFLLSSCILLLLLLLIIIIISAGGGKSKALDWDHLRDLGVGYWLLNPNELRSIIEAVAKNRYMENKDPKAAMLFYLVCFCASFFFFLLLLFFFFLLFSLSSSYSSCSSSSSS